MCACGGGVVVCRFVMHSKKARIQTGLQKSQGAAGQGHSDRLLQGECFAASLRRCSCYACPSIVREPEQLTSVWNRTPSRSTMLAISCRYPNMLSSFLTSEVFCLDRYLQPMITNDRGERGQFKQRKHETCKNPCDCSEIPVTYYIIGSLDICDEHQS